MYSISWWMGESEMCLVNHPLYNFGKLFPRKSVILANNHVFFFFEVIFSHQMLFCSSLLRKIGNKVFLHKYDLISVRALHFDQSNVLGEL